MDDQERERRLELAWKELGQALARSPMGVGLIWILEHVSPPLERFGMRHPRLWRAIEVIGWPVRKWLG